ncbi:hypothetical protein QQX98_013218 [Neonectria punicea]|uniref:Uncharacterized protein n=1 Tax=Neonectria punicea TaxID=979145 RepID=A0ABR1GGP2_9HYPO
MSLHVIQVRTRTGQGLDEEAIRQLVETSDGAGFLPSPLIYPPMYIIKGTEELAEQLQQKLGEVARIDVLQEFQEQ